MYQRYPPPVLYWGVWGGAGCEYIMENPSNSEYDFIKQTNKQTEELSFTFLILSLGLHRIVHFYKK